MAYLSIKEPDTGVTAWQTIVGRVNSTWAWRKNYWNGDGAWERAYRTLRGEHWTYGEDFDQLSSDIPRERITVNLTGSTIQNMVPFLMRRNPTFYLYARKKEHEESARLQEIALNYEWKRQKMQREAKKCVVDAATIGHAICKTGFNFELKQSDNQAADGNIDYDFTIKQQSPFIRRVNPFLFLFDPMAKDRELRNSRWCAEIAYDACENILANPQYSNKAKKLIKEGFGNFKTTFDLMKSTSSDSKLMSAANDTPIETSYLILFEVWDKKFEKYYLFADGVECPLVERAWPYEYLENFPYIKLDFIPLPDEPYGIGICRWLEDQQYELNRIRTAMFDHIRRNNPKYLAVEGGIEPEELTKLEFGRAGSVVFVKDLSFMKPMDVAEIPKDKFAVEATIKQDMRELSGEDEMMRGGNLADRTTATEVTSRINMFGAKLDERVELVDGFIEDIGSQVLAHIKAGYEDEQIYRVIGQDGVNWIKLTPDEIQAATDIEIESTSKPKADIQVDRQQLMTFVELLLKSEQQLMMSGVQVNYYELLKEVADKFNIKVFNKIVQPVNAQAMMMQQQQMQMGGNQIPQQPPPPGAPSGKMINGAMRGAIAGGEN